jgi:hypothetical protein
MQSGNLVMIKNGTLNELSGREMLMAYRSTDDGQTWSGGLLLDERSTVSYPDIAQSEDGTIYVVYDWNRSRDKNILMATFLESDIEAKAFVSPVARRRILVDKQSGYNPERWLKEGHYIGLRADRAAAEFEPGKRPELASCNGDVRRFEKWNYLFSDKALYIQNTTPELEGKNYVCSAFEYTQATFSSPGMVYVITPTPSRNSKFSQEKRLLDDGFEKTSIKEFVPFLRPQSSDGSQWHTKEIGAVQAARRDDACSVYQKEVQAGETVRFGEWGVLVF